MTTEPVGRTQIGNIEVLIFKTNDEYHAEFWDVDNRENGSLFTVPFSPSVPASVALVNVYKYAYRLGEDAGRRKERDEIQYGFRVLADAMGFN